tara:strand:- start:646 stop:1734 length:1089 start_codon:yes stop_codon:yes gene_type:complete
MKNEFIKIKFWWNDLDKFILIPTCILISIGIMLVFSASQILGSKYELSQYYLIKKHIVFVIIGIFTILTLSALSPKNIILCSVIILSLAMILSIIAIIFFSEFKGASRWIKISNFSLQPSELIKPSFVIVSALLFSRYKNKNDSSIIFNIILLLIISSILISQPDFGMFLLVFIVWFSQLLMARINLKIISFMSFSFFSALVFCFFFLDHVQFRLKNFFLNIGDNYQISKSLESFSSGGFFGKGIGAGQISKTLPDVHSDFIFALAGEELGIIFTSFILLIYLFIFWRIYLISINEKNFFNFSALIGLSNIFIFQTLINVSSSLNLFPTKGMTLPFISYGGSSMLSCAILIGFILSLTKKSR